MILFGRYKYETATASEQSLASFQWAKSPKKQSV